MLIRLILLLIIPAVLLAIYLEGQEYEPQIVKFTENPIEAELKALLPDTLGSYHSSGSLRIYNKENLYEYIDGHAEYFISAGFSSLIVREYTDNDKTAQFRVEAYRMKRAIEALGVLNDESSFGAKPVNLATAAYQSDEGLSFTKGPYYVKITSLKGTPDLFRIATSILKRINVDDNSLEILEEFPEIGEPIKTEYHREAYRGIEILRDIVVRRYSFKGKEISVFMKKGKKEDLQTTYNNLINYFKNNDIHYDITQLNDNDLLTIDDPYEGRWYLYFTNERMIGFSGINNQKEFREILANMTKNLEKV